MDAEALSLLHRAATSAEAARVRSDEVADRLDAMALALDDVREKQTVLAVEARFSRQQTQRIADDVYGTDRKKGLKQQVDEWRAQLTLLVWLAGGNGLVAVAALVGTIMQATGS